MKIIGSLSLWVSIMLISLPMNFLFIFAWNHSLTELWVAIPHLSYWQGYLLLTVASFLVPYNVFVLENK